MTGWKRNVGAKTRNANMIPGTEGGRAMAKLPWKFLELAGRLLRPVNGVDNVTTWRGDLIVGTIPANGAR